MNKQEFYKELMKEYTFDSAKVRRNAKLSSLHLRNTNKRWWYLPSTAAVAAVAVTVGLFSLFYNNGSSPALPDTQDGNAVRERISVEYVGYGNKTLFLSFNDSITFSEMRDSFDSVSDTGNIIVDTVYILEDDNTVTSVSVSGNLEKLEELSGTDNIIGAKIHAPATLIPDFTGRREVALVELGDNIGGDDDFIPLIAVEIGNAHTEYEPHTGEEITTEPEPGTTSVYSEKYVNFNMPGVSEAVFISDYRFTAVTSHSVMLCEISETDFEVNVISEFPLYNLKKRRSVTGKSFLLNGIDGNGKAVLLLADADSGTLENVDIGSLVDSGELLNAFYDDVNRRIIMRVRNSGSNAIYIVNRDTFGLLLVPESDNDAAILAVKGSTVYFSAGTSVMKYNISEGTVSELYTFTADAVSFERNADLSGFVVNTGENSLMFFAETETFTESVAAENGLLFYGDSADLLTDGTNIYRAYNNGVIEIYEGQPFSPEYGFESIMFKVDEIADDTVKILIR